MDPFIPYVVAELRAIELREQAEHDRLVATCRRDSRRRRFQRARRAFGLRLIRAGARLTVTQR